MSRISIVRCSKGKEIKKERKKERAERRRPMTVESPDPRVVENVEVAALARNRALEGVPSRKWCLAERRFEMSRRVI